MRPTDHLPLQHRAAAVVSPSVPAAMATGPGPVPGPPTANLPYARPRPSQPVLSLPDAEVAVTPGEETRVRVGVHNAGSIVDSFCIELRGPAREWAAPRPPEVRLFPGQDGETTIIFRPPVDDGPDAGLLPFAVKATPVDDPANSTVEETMLRVNAVRRLSAQLVPLTSVGWRWGRHRLWVTNPGNVALPVNIGGTDPEGGLRFRIRPRRFVVPAGSGRRVTLRVGGLGWFLTGADRHHRFSVTAQADGAPDVVQAGAYRQRPLLRRWVVAALAALAALALVGYFLLRPVVASTAQTATKPHPTPGAPITHGPQGPAGPAGKSGIAGPAGPTGQAGALGKSGPAGKTGPQGAHGHAGAAGQPGKTGAPGANGPTGATGPQGATGLPGPPGPQGAQGPIGQQGPAGRAGITNAYQQALLYNTCAPGPPCGLGINATPTVIVNTPALQPGNYDVNAYVSAFGSNPEQCWIVPQSSGPSNVDNIQAQVDGQSGAMVSLNDVWTVTQPGDELELVCQGLGVASDASITALQVTNATTSSIRGYYVGPS